MNKVIHGDCLEVLKTLPDNSVDAVVTDPPYGLSFMGKKWDYDVPSIEIWQECNRVLKPGGYLLAFAGTRTQHRMAVRIEDAGFEIRDMIAWVYGSGFPKSRNITLDMDKMEGHPNRGHRIAVANRYHPDGTLEPNGEILPAYEPKSENAKKWNGWGTALKPALEPITVARKPLSENTVAENCLKWGVGGINIDGCRVNYASEYDKKHQDDIQKGQLNAENGKFFGGNGKSVSSNNLQGRFPANLIHDGSDEVVSLFPNTKSVRSKRGGATNGNGKNIDYGDFNKIETYEAGFNDSGSASRFFYCAKASKSERNRGCEAKNNHPTVKPIALMEYLVKLVSREGTVVLDPFAGSGSTLIACKNLNREYIGIEREQDYIDIINKRLV